MKTEDIKIWQHRLPSKQPHEPALWREESKARQEETDELRAALKERDAEIVSLHSQWEQSRNETDAAHTHLATQRLVMQQALEAAEKFRDKCHDGRARSVETYDDMTQLVTALKEALK